MQSDDVADSWDLALSQYLDQELTSTEEAALLLELDCSPDLQARFARMKIVHDALQNVAQQAQDEASTMPSMWSAIASQLQMDTMAANPEVQIDANNDAAHYQEMASAYFDGELNVEEQAQFEVELLHQPQINQLLINFDSLSSSISHLVSHCDVDIASNVLSEFETEKESELINDQAVLALLPAGLTLEQMEMLSAHIDEELKPQETIALNRLIENEPQAKQSLQQLNHLRDAVQQATQRWEAQAPLISWNDIQTQLTNDPVFLSDARQKREKRSAQFKKAMWLGAPMAAAAALLLLSWPALQMNELLGTNLSLTSDGNLSSTAVQIASLPHRRNGNLSRLSSNGESVPSLPVLPVLRSASHENPSKSQTMLVPTQPILDPAVHQLATRRAGSRPDAPNFGGKKGKSPSSEEYLFNALDEQGSGAELSNLLND
jgi:hypothetical protein